MRFDREVTVRHVRYANDASGWAVLEAAASDGTPVALVGPLVHLEVGERAQVVGEWVTDSRFGRQVKVAQARPLAPLDPGALTDYLCRVRHVGAKRAAALVARFGAEEVLDAVDRDPAAALQAVGLRRARAAEAAASWQELRVTRRLHLLLAPHALAYLAPRIHEHFGADAHERVSEDPYALTSVFGVGFHLADRIARATGGDAGDGRRDRAALVHTLAEAERSGSSCLPRADLHEQAAALLGAPADGAALDALAQDGRVVIDGDWAYRAATFALETELARRVDELVAADPDERLARGDGGGRCTPQSTPIELTDEQRGAVTGALRHRLSVVTGGPGTGKTATIRSIAIAAESRRARVLLVAPTGRAAVRMTEASGIRATTVHSALGWIPGEGPTHDEHDPLACDLLIVDETSMANLELLVTLLRAVRRRTHVVLVGDADQLAPVGAGKPFAELVGAAGIPVTRLSHIFRQAADSMIVQGAHAIRRGEAPAFAATAGMRRDLFLIERADPAAALAEVVSLVAQRLPSHYGVDAVSDIQVFAPVYRGELGIDALNRELRAALNPDGRPVRGGRLRIGDKLMMTGRNLHELGLMNGTVLRLLDEIADGNDDDEPAALLLGADGAVFRLDANEADRLAPAYACSVHRGQGIELPIAVIVAHPAAGAFFLRREMLYTAITRARLATIVVGSHQVVARAARTPDTARRHGRLAQRLTAVQGSPPRAQATNDQLANCAV